jgi:hypothetical protein
VFLRPARSRRRALRAERVDLVHEDQAGRVESRSFEQIAHARRADADDDLDELRAGHRVEGHVRFARDGFRDESLAHARTSLHQ